MRTGRKKLSSPQLRDHFKSEIACLCVGKAKSQRTPCLPALKNGVLRLILIKISAIHLTPFHHWLLPLCGAISEIGVDGSLVGHVYFSRNFFKILEDGVFLPKIGFVSCRFRKEIKQEFVKNITLSHDPFRDRYFVSVCFEAEVDFLSETCQSIGLDMGSVRLFTDSSGNFVEALRENPVVSRLLEGIRAEQRKFSDILRKAKSHVKGAGRQLRRKRKTLHVLHRKLADFARDVLHKLSREIIGENDLVVVEDLNIRGMTASASGTLEEPGNHVKQKSGLNRNLLSNRISMFFQFLAYKRLWHGKKCVRVDPKHTSQKCSHCCHTDKDNRLDQSHFRCRECGNKMNADHNAAINILNAGLNPALASGSRQVK